MSEGKDPAIKLFGKTIQLPETPLTDAVSGGGGCDKSEDRSSSSSSLLSEEKFKGERESSDGDDKDVTEEKPIDKDEGRAHSTMSEDVTDPTTASVLSENPKTPSPENEPVTTNASKSEEDPNETEKTLKKPDKILPCPRCNSMDTKFCYFNNYNVNQPRHFCKNCQRYWTAGGTMRNVPVGAGRRKNKAAAVASQFRQITAADELLVKPNGGVLAFGSVSDTPLCESMASVLNIADNPVGPNGLRKPEPLLIPVHSNDNRPPCLPGGYGPWAYPWNPQMGAASAFGPPGFPMPFYPPPPYWACPIPGPWNVGWLAPPVAAAHSGPNSPTLGKHPREETVAESADETTEQNGPEKPTEQNGPEKCLWVPKTLRIDDPDEAAKSSIWATLGIKKDGFKAFRSKREEHDDAVKETSTALRANPAALSRSRNFQESS